MACRHPRAAASDGLSASARTGSAEVPRMLRQHTVVVKGMKMNKDQVKGSLKVVGNAKEALKDAPRKP